MFSYVMILIRDFLVLAAAAAASHTHTCPHRSAATPGRAANDSLGPLKVTHTLRHRPVVHCAITAWRSFRFSWIYLLRYAPNRDFLVLAAAAAPAAPLIASISHAPIAGGVDRFKWSALLLVLTKRVRAPTICISGRAWFNPVL